MKNAASLINYQPYESHEDFNPSPDSSCFCDSGKTFGQCCGSTRAVRPPPFGLFIFENFLDRAVAADLVDFAKYREGEHLKVIDQKQSTADQIVKVNDGRRVAERVDLGSRNEQLHQIVKTAFINMAEHLFSARLQWYESPDLMRYHPGGFYARHADSENIDSQTRLWKKVIDRDLSLLIYLNDDFEGGLTRFYRFNYYIRPKAGGAVLFPADNRYLHAAEIVTKGDRYAIVSWAAIRGVPKMTKHPPQSAVLLE